LCLINEVIEGMFFLFTPLLKLSQRQDGSG
jgi:hypothetical protein